MFENFRLPQNDQEMAELEIDKNCVIKTGFAGVTGYLLGGVVGLFFSSLEFSGPSLDPKLHDLNTKQQLRIMLKDMSKRSLSTAKNFGVIGAIFSGSECLVEGYRGKTDIYNVMSAGCFTGGVLGLQGGPYGAIPGCLGFAAFSAAIDHFMRGM